MKKILQIGCLVVVMMFLAVPSWSFSYTPPTDSILLYEVGSPADAAEKGYLADYLGLTLPELEALYIYDKNEAIGDNDYKELVPGFDPGFAWDYAIVKVDGPGDYWYLFMDDNSSGSLSGGDDVLTTPKAGQFPYNTGNPAKGISHISWFRTTAVPEPMTLLLLGLGLVGLAGVRRGLKK